MVLISLGFVLGAWLLQQQAALPSLIWLPIIAVGLLLTFLLHHAKAFTYLRLPSLFITTGLIGFFYAALFATMRLGDDLPRAWEQKDIQIIGVVATMAEVTARGERFQFDVEQVITPDAQVPKQITLSYYQGNAWHTPNVETDGGILLRPSTFKAGERWKLTVRLKRPHTTYNPNGYDFEAWALAHNIRAMGTIRSKRGLEKVSDFVWRPRYMVAYCREAVGNKMSHVLGNKPYAGVIRALVIGDDSQISVKDWNVYLRTGVNHLMSIFYLLKRKFLTIFIALKKHIKRTILNSVVPQDYFCINIFK